MSPELINKITNIIGVVVIVGTIVSDSLGSVPAGSKWYVYAGAVVSGVILYFMGKGALALKKDNNLK